MVHMATVFLIVKMFATDIMYVKVFDVCQQMVVIYSKIDH